MKEESCCARAPPIFITSLALSLNMLTSARTPRRGARSHIVETSAARGKDGPLMAALDPLWRLASITNRRPRLTEPMWGLVKFRNDLWVFVPPGTSDISAL
jgi:hypothetical protein